jgi:farnesyl-diphosphate farnesyltransferase/isopentenyl-diphosphate delta-isomerase type 1
MIKDECIRVNDNDEIVGHESKKESHIFNKKNPRGLLHRAFSVFLFNEEGKLLLQQRAQDKITFPGVWTNTCCSHPLYGFDPAEVDSPDDVASGQVPGVKNAAVRKLEHELGISAKKLKHSDFKFLTRLHYWAADVVTHGPKATWGEHEIDYILFIKKKVTFKANPEEVCDTKYVTLQELQEMMKPSSGLLWSPWFRIIAEQFLIHWWKDLDTTLTTNKYVDYKTIYRFDPTEEHMGGAGNAGKLLGAASYHPASDNGNGHATAVTHANGNKGLKQGAYGKVKIHKHSKLTQLYHFDEIFSAFWLTFVDKMDNKIELKDENCAFCDDMLNKVSRSFAAVIHQLPKGLCMDILIFYLALRALDTIEDDMTAFKGREQEKVKHLNEFYKVGLVTDGWRMEGVGEGDERTLLENYDKCVAVFKMLSPASQEVIAGNSILMYFRQLVHDGVANLVGLRRALLTGLVSAVLNVSSCVCHFADITKRMGQGMASYVEKDLGQGTVDVPAYNLYCHYVAGLVGEGLSRLFTCTGYESAKVDAVAKTIANTTGLFLQKTNIIRDYLEDYVDGRTFWPQSIWKQYTTGNDLGELAQPQARDRALACLNHMIMDALTCAPDSLEYMSLLHTEEVFRFCAIPQVMAIATLAELYNNPQVFTGVVKIRKGMAAQLILDTTTVGGLHKWFNIMARRIEAAIPVNDPNAEGTHKICQEIIRITDKEGQTAIAGAYAKVFTVLAVVGIIASAFKLFAEDVLKQDGPFKLDLSLFSAFHKHGGAQDALGHDCGHCKTLYVVILAVCVAQVLGYSIVAAGRKGLKKAD